MSSSRSAYSHTEHGLRYLHALQVSATASDQGDITVYFDAWGSAETQCHLHWSKLAGQLEQQVRFCHGRV
jgi:hypothetical protein